MNPNFNESQPMEVINDFHGAQIFRINTDNVDIFLEYGRKYDLELPKHADEKGRIKCIYVIDKVPPLSAVLKFVESPYAQGVTWGAYAVIMPEDLSMISKFIPIVTYGLSITPLKDKYAVKTFSRNHRNDLTEVIAWLNKVTDSETQEIDVAEGQS